MENSPSKVTVQRRNMTRICPKPKPWDKAYNRLTSFAEAHDCTPPLPPKPLILNGWVFSNDIEKMNR